MSPSKRETLSVSASVPVEESPLHDLNALVNQHHVPVVVVKDDLLNRLPFVVFVGETAARQMAELALSAIKSFVPLTCFLTYFSL